MLYRVPVHFFQLFAVRVVDAQWNHASDKYILQQQIANQLFDMLWNTWVKNTWGQSLV